MERDGAEKWIGVVCVVQGYLAHKKHPPPRTPHKDYLGSYGGPGGGGAVSYERGTPVGMRAGWQVDPLGWVYRGTSLIRNSGRLGPNSGIMPRALWQS